MAGGAGDARASRASEPAERSERRSGERATLLGSPRGDAPRLRLLDTNRPDRTALVSAVDREPEILVTEFGLPPPRLGVSVRHDNLEDRRGLRRFGGDVHVH